MSLSGEEEVTHKPGCTNIPALGVPSISVQELDGKGQLSRVAY
jgi:hypothetical protein